MTDVYATRALDFVERLQQLTTFDEVSRLIIAELKWFGFEYITSWAIPGPGTEAKDRVVLNTRPLDYIDRYNEKKYFLHDPVVTELRKNVSPFSWGDVRAHRELTKSETRILDEGREFDAYDGFIVPIISATGEIALFSPCGRNPNLIPRARSALEIIGVFSHHALRRVLAQRVREETSHTPLTPREREIMQWVAAGKSDDEIADILSIGRTTVTAHVENAKRKLDAFRRTQAVAQAIRFGEVAL
jgi:LuxR family quorum sensing-dependent transcriptional regulator